jgi:lipoxygenase
MNNFDGMKTITYKLKFKVEPDFGIPGALVMRSEHKHKFFLESATLETLNQTIHFNCNS